ncbi:class I SAM-dependent methyltransferase [Ornithinibacillus salinisoli]|uniref:Class I SAM-dependent methyltransferase n=1 Tax=Ornithinibacillus salinisoli TaxID=1848459 RepID=A0ABW4W7F5_9BACI
MYQDIWVKGKVVQKGQRECENRYKKIKEQLTKNYRNEPFTVLDLGANNGYFSFRIAEDFNARVTMIESNDKIREIVKLNENDHVELINRHISENELNKLVQKEKFDVILALSVLHHFEGYEQVIDTLFHSSKFVFIEPSALEESKGGYNSSRVIGIMKNLQARNPEILTYSKNIRNLGKRPLMMFKQ